MELRTSGVWGRSGLELATGISTSLRFRNHAKWRVETGVLGRSGGFEAALGDELFELLLAC